jgi:hypothetical protein
MVVEELFGYTWEAVEKQNEMKGTDMAEQMLKDSRGKWIGSITTQSNGIQIAKDAQGRRVGEYDPKTNVTKDVSGKRVGTGNFLSSLITSLH